MRHIAIVLLVMIVAFAGALLVARAYDIETCDRVIRQSEQGLRDFYVTEEESATCDRVGREILPTYKLGR